MPTTRQGLNSAAIKQLINQHVADAMAAYEANQSNGNANQNKAGGSAGVVGLTRLFEKMEFVFCISNCAKNFQVKYATCTLLNSALTWWKYHVKTVGIDVAYAMTWKELMKMMTEVYCPRNEIQKMENELWNLTVKGNDVVDEEEKIERRYVLLLQRMLTTKESGKMSKKENNHQQQNKRQEVVRVYISGTGNKTGVLEFSDFEDKVQSCHHSHDPMSQCGGKGPTKRYYTGPENQNGDEEAHQNLDIATGTFPLKNHYILVLTNASTNRSFVFTAISHLSDVASTLSVA
ncbi:reverse transcriptase domain-containing protein [Tanacetum coccineum]